MEELLKIKFKDKIMEGLLIKEDTSEIHFKLKNGYNVILSKSDVEILSKTKLDKLSSHKNKPIKKNPKLPDILLLHTGGTIASKVDYETGAVSSQISPEEIIGLYPELLSRANISSKLISNLSSEDLRFEHYNILLDILQKEISENIYDGIIISHGTDTMHYTSAALHYAMRNLPLPILLVGSQRSSDRPSSDAYLNLLSAVTFISEFKTKKKQYRRVGICMHSSLNNDSFYILDGLNARKMHTTRRDAFKQINFKPFALISQNKVTVLREMLLTELPEKTFLVQKYNTSLKIGFFKAHPNLHSEELSMLKIYDGVVIDGTGLGHLGVSQFDEASLKNLKNLAELKTLLQTTKLVMSTQCVNGVTNMNIYSSGRRIKKLGILGNNSNLISETLFARLSFCLSCKEKPFEKLWQEDLEQIEQNLSEISFD